MMKSSELLWHASSSGIEGRPNGLATPNQTLPHSPFAREIEWRPDNYGPVELEVSREQCAELSPPAEKVEATAVMGRAVAFYR